VEKDEPRSEAYGNHDFLNGYYEWSTQSKKRALVISVYGRTGYKELHGCMSDGWFMKRFLEKQGYEVVWLKDFTVDHTVLKEQTQKTLVYNPYVLVSSYARAFVKDKKYSELTQIERDHQPTKSNVLERLKQLAAMTQSGDSAFVHYSGHGSNMNIGRTNYLFLTPEKYEKAGYIRTMMNAISDTELYKNFTEKLPAGANAMMLFDACLSGRMGNLRFRAEGNGGWKEHTKERNWPKANVISLSGCDDNELSGDCGQRYGGVMTRAFLETIGFTLKARQNCSPIGEKLFDTYLEKVYKKLSLKDFLQGILSLISAQGHTQRPQLECSLPLDQFQNTLGPFMGSPDMAPKMNEGFKKVFTECFCRGNWKCDVCVQDSMRKTRQQQCRNRKLLLEKTINTEIDSGEMGNKQLFQLADNGAERPNKLGEMELQYDAPSRPMSWSTLLAIYRIRQENKIADDLVIAGTYLPFPLPAKMVLGQLGALQYTFTEDRLNGAKLFDGKPVTLRDILLKGSEGDSSLRGKKYMFEYKAKFNLQQAPMLQTIGVKKEHIFEKYIVERPLKAIVKDLISDIPDLQKFQGMCK